MSPASRRFAILEHHHQGVHWDLLIEETEGGLLRTWALEQAPDHPGAIVARELPAHRRIYLDYAGPISGNRGWVRSWDRGLALVRVWTGTEVVIELTGSQLVGLAELTREGDAPDRVWRFRLGKLS